MKKTILKGILILSMLMLASCKSTKVNDDGADKTGKNYLGWVDSTGKDVVYKDGIVQLRVKQSLGTFNLGVINDNERVVPILSTADEFTTSAFYLKTLKKTYLLRKDGIIKSSASRTKNGVTLNYGVEKVFNFAVSFDMMESGEKGTSDMVKVTCEVTNIGNKRDEFSMKAIFDTVLGETDKYHFYTLDNVPVKNEVAYRTMQNQKYIVSKNKSAAVEFIFNGADTTAPELVALANYSTFQKNSWEPEMLSYRAFDTVLSYNNSALGVLWPSVKLKPSESAKNIFYIAFATDGDEPSGHNLICKEEKKEENVQKVVMDDKKVAAPDPVQVAPVVPVEEPVTAPAPVPAPVPAPAAPVVMETQIEPDPLPEETVNGLTKKQLSPEYIQNLIDRITELEQDTTKVDSAELLRLNNELDEILSALR